MEMLRDKIKGLERKIVEMIRHGQDNVAIADKLHRWTRALMLTANAADLPDVLVRELQHQFLIPQAAIRVWGAAEVFAALPFAGAVERRREELREQPDDAVLRRQRRLRGGAVARRRRRSALVAGADPAAPREPAPARSACSCSRSPDPTRYTADMGTEFLARIGEIASAGADAAAAAQLTARGAADRRGADAARDADIARHLEYLRVERRLAARTLALYGEAFDRLQALRRGASALPLREAQTHHVRRWAAQLHGRGLAPRSHRARAVGLARLLPLARPRRPGRRQPGRRRARAARRASRCRRRCRSTTRSRWSRIATTTATRASPRATRCIVELLYGCGLRVGELVGLDVVASGERGRLDRCRATRARTSSARAAKRRSRAGRRAGARGARRVARAARRHRARRRAGALRQQPRHAADARARCARA